MSVASALALGLLIASAALDCGGKPETPPDSDLSVIESLEEAGSDLSKEHVPEFFLYLPSEPAARQAAERLRAEGFLVTVEPAADGVNWLCLASKSMRLERSALLELRRELQSIVAPLGGQYDGWGAPVVQ